MKWIRYTKKRMRDGKQYEIAIIKYKGKPDTLMFINGKWCWRDNSIIETEKYPVEESSWSAIEYLDESDHSDEEAAFNAAREAHHGLGYSIVPGKYEYPTFTDYLKSKQEL